ncbi:hypothetical protein NDU88_002088 [Pleurodeles waltl]|uniref:Gypsy retrotransposon integrase-like protein 1 n=1 Tax=Pleurodeles waltl TaxID=8319 RepID=A0AAV7LEN0_PLEWA|nr:hypothetical protein NDU88_002088 [Pleurodeles waltl]
MRTTCTKAQEKLLCHRNPSLEKVVSTIKSMERSAKEITLLRKPDNHSADVNLIRKESESSTSQKVFKVEEYKTDEDSDDNEMMENLVLLVAFISKEDLHNQPKCNIHVNGESVEMLVDTGSRITILSKNTYETLGCKAPLQVSKVIPGAYGGHKIKLEGVFNADLKFKDKSTSSKVVVVDYNVNILGWLEQQSLRMLINPCQPPYVFSIQKDSLENILEEYKDVFSGKLGCLKNFKHKIILKEGVQPVKQRVRNIPFSARSEVKAILKNWCDEGIIEPINASEWLSLVVLEHISGKANVTADYLSRAPCISETDCEENEYDDDVLVACLFNSEEPHSTITKQEWEEATRNDNVFTEIKKYIMEGWPREKRLNETLQPYWKIKNDITIVDEVFLRGETLIAPMSLRGRLVALAHEGHVGMTGTKQKLRERYWWAAMDREVDIFVSQCSVCAKANKSMSAHHCPMLSVELPEGPWLKIGIDFIGPMNVLPLNMRYAIVIFDYFSKWIEVKFVK